MSYTNRKEHGFSPVETLLVIAIVAVIGLVGWYVYHAKQTTDKSLNAANTTSNNAGPRFASQSKQAASAGNSNADLQSDLQSASSTSSQSGKDLSTANGSLNDKSTLTSVPQ